MGISKEGAIFLWSNHHDQVAQLSAGLCRVFGPVPLCLQGRGLNFHLVPFPRSIHLAGSNAHTDVRRVHGCTFFSTRRRLDTHQLIIWRLLGCSVPRVLDQYAPPAHKRAKSARITLLCRLAREANDTPTLAQMNPSGPSQVSEDAKDYQKAAVEHTHLHLEIRDSSTILRHGRVRP